MFRKLLAPFLALTLYGAFVLGSVGVRADAPAPQNTYNVSGTGQTQPILLQGGNVCGGSVSTLTGSPTFAITAQSSSDYPANQPGTWATASNVGSVGAITATGAFTPGVVSTTGVAAFRLNITALSGGTIQVIVSCSGAAGSSGGGGGGNVTIISPLPLPVTVQNGPATPIVSAPIAALVGPAAPTTAPGGGNVGVVTANGEQLTAFASAQPITCVSGCGGAPTVAPTVLPTATPGYVPAASAPPVAAYLLCLNNGGAPSITSGNVGMVNCTAGGILKASLSAQAGTNTMAGGVQLCGNNSGVNCASPGPAPTASAGAAPLSTAIPVVSYSTCSVNSGVIAVTNTNVIMHQCDPNGNLKTLTEVQTSVATPVLLTGCSSTAAVNISTATTTSIVAVSGSKAVYICAYHLYVVSGTLPSLQFEYGTGAACTGPTVLSGTFGGIAAAIGESFELGAGLGYVLSVPASNGFCIVSGGTTPNIQGWVSYAQY